MSLLVRAACISGLKWHLLEAGHHFQAASASSTFKVWGITVASGPVDSQVECEMPPQLLAEIILCRHLEINSIAKASNTIYVLITVLTQGSLHSAARALCTSAGAEEQEDVAAVKHYRDSKSFRRRVDGRVLLHGKESDTWMEAKLDGYVEGSLLLRGQDGLVYYLVSEDLKQIDLSNDQLVGQLFGEGSWEKLMQPLYTQLAGGELKHVRMTPQQFRSIFTVLREAPPPAQA
ncbi:hypothetical protein Vretifemale_16843 [Volvox reticuliferus]|uniref:Uncharacterized protein n=1 Tax=Volvox reticuliferus TaxID=1737510 RepID=A0A8J4CUH7_9CHLO|nr:hypothetical protein Vretifemale_16843 [Volvox reticuliferus]